ncbi:glycosyltransferase family 2 protein [Myxococcota bacterium]|nr:glycosyltransferase family 2 protein [Myxococcota bacterium]
MPIAVLIPARDEGPRVARTVREVMAALPGAAVLVVDGGSRDDTAWQARRAGAQVVSQRGTGYAGALLSGYQALLAGPARRVVQLDADGQHPAVHAPRLLAALGEGRHLALASRHGTDSPGPWARRAGNHLLSELVQGLTGARLHDVTSGFWAMDRHALTLLARHMPGDCADANVRVLAVRLGLRPVEVAVPMTTRTSGRSMHDGWRGAANFAVSVRRAVEAGRLQVGLPRLEPVAGALSDAAGASG